MPRRRLTLGFGLLGLSGFVILMFHGSVALEVTGGVLLGGALLFVVALIVVRLGPQTQPDREREALAREEFARTGEWPS